MGGSTEINMYIYMYMREGKTKKQAKANKQTKQTRQKQHSTPKAHLTSSWRIQVHEHEDHYMYMYFQLATYHM